MNTSRTEHNLLMRDGKVYIMGGYDRLSNAFLNTCEIYEIETN